MLFDFDKNAAYATDKSVDGPYRLTNDMYDRDEYKDCPYDLLCEVRYIRFYDEDEKQSFVKACNEWDVTNYGLDKKDGLTFIYDSLRDEFVPLYEKVSELYDELDKLRRIELTLNPDYKENSF